MAATPISLQHIPQSPQVLASPTVRHSANRPETDLSRFHDGFSRGPRRAAQGMPRLENENLVLRQAQEEVFECRRLKWSSS
jgi:hypothetical protein